MGRRSATKGNARTHYIPSGYSLKNWDPLEEPIFLLASVFDANSLGKWIFDWTVYHHGRGMPIADMAGELWLLLIKLAGNAKRAEMFLLRNSFSIPMGDRDMLDDFVESKKRLMERLEAILEECEKAMMSEKGRRGESSGELNKNAGVQFVETMFGRDRCLAEMEKFMSSTTLWNIRFGANCEDILRGAVRQRRKCRERRDEEKPSSQDEVCKRCGRGGTS